ncbi:MAG: ABC transporter substrate-binding protein [Candidatus Omnitrophica bacterium]|nr:ABC transporter substrate-binding protein [Candidatus Omnitrophota bacterium]
MKKVIVLLFATILAFQLAGCADKEQNSDTVKVVYWEKWSGFEADAMQAVIDLFNSRKFTNKDGKLIHVEMSTVSEIDRRLLTAVAGGNPPDVAGVWTWLVTAYAEKGALLPIDDHLREAAITEDRYIPVFWEICKYKGKMWGLPSTPASVALHWNKRLFREAGLDPNVPPSSIQEFDEMAEKLTLIKLPGQDKAVSFYELKGKPDHEDLLGQGTIIQMGFLPSEPGWWPWSWGYWFGGELWNGKEKVTADDPGNVKAYEWVKSYSDKYGVDNIKKFSSSFGTFASPQNAFLSSKVAMVREGVWMYNFIDKYATGMDWDAAPFPSDGGKLKDVTYAEADILVIPIGARHPDEAFKFISFVNTQEAMELLCEGQRKFTPLKNVSEDFYARHKNPHIRVFRALAESPNAFTTPKMVIWQEYLREMSFAYEMIRDLKAEPEEVLSDVRKTMQKRLERELEMSKRAEERR